MTEAIDRTDGFAAADARCEQRADPLGIDRTDGFAAADARCEHLVDPLGIDRPAPSFSWRIRASGRDRRQSAYRVLVASAPGVLDSGAGDKWDSGRVASDATAGVAYAGAPLRSGERCWWKVQVWDGDGRRGADSPPAVFEMALLAPGDWAAAWIGADPAVSAPLLRKEFRLAGPPERARCYVTGLGYYELYVNGRRVGDQVLDPATTYYHNDQPFELGSRVLYATHDVTRLLRAGQNAVGLMLGHGWYSAEDDVPPSPSHREPYGPAPVGLLQLAVELGGGERVRVVSDGTWTASAGPVAYNDYCHGETYDARLEQPGWAEPGFDDSAWAPARPAAVPSGALRAQPLPPIRVVRTLDPVSASSPEPGSDDKAGAGPARSVPSKCRRVAEPGGDDEAGASLCGRDDEQPGRRTVTVYDFGQNLTGWTRLRVTGPAGSRVTVRHGHGVGADDRLDNRSNMYAWPDDPQLRAAGLAEGDEGLEHGGVGFHHGARQTDQYVLRGAADPAAAPAGRQPEDLARARGGAADPAAAPAGRQAEDLAQARDPDAPADRGSEVREPRFTLHGFRCAEVVCDPGVTVEGIEARHARTAVAETGRFECSDELVNRIHRNVTWTFASSMQGFPQDAADRSERVGWLGDPVAGDFAFTFDSLSFWSKWLDDLADSQKPDGDLPVIAPLHWRRTHDAYLMYPVWKSSYPVVAWDLYLEYGDARVLEDHYERIEALVAFLSRRAEGGLLSGGLGDHMEPQPDGTSAFEPVRTPAGLTSTAFYCRGAEILAMAAEVLGRRDRAERYWGLAADIAAAFNRAYFDAETSNYATGSQAANAVPLALGLVPPEHEASVLANIVADIESRGGRLSTGMLGTDALIRVLSEHGRADVIHIVATGPGFPSWGEQAAKGATTLWEAWEGETDPQLSLNMKLFGSIQKFFFRDLAGIRRAAPGYAAFSVAPQVVGGLEWARAHIDTARGPISSNWRLGGGAFELEAEVPPNARATIRVPKLGRAEPAIAEGGEPVWPAAAAAARPGIARAFDEAEAVAFEVGSGRYSFVSLMDGESLDES